MAPSLSVVQNTDTVIVRAPARRDVVARPPVGDVAAADTRQVAAVGIAPPAHALDRSDPQVATATVAQHKRKRPVRRWVAAPVLAGAAYVCWVLSRQVLWGVQEREPWTVLSVSALVYLVVVAWTMVLVAVTVWSGHRSGRIFWPWVLLICGPGFAYLYHFASVNKAWGGSVGADFYEMIVLLAALSLLALVAVVALAARVAPTRRMLRRRRGLAPNPLTAAATLAADAPGPESRRGPSPDATA
jgi:hypothetical protein